ncbi:unnamed protein product [marine sediment metagenome]|uniref:Uncharacterized protein n=1 Tax=marine sediment metagenome TaxID=412755 RepID=X1AB57_9ZZZZ
MRVFEAFTYQTVVSLFIAHYFQSTTSPRIAYDRVLASVNYSISGISIKG